MRRASRCAGAIPSGMKALTPTYDSCTSRRAHGRVDEVVADARVERRVGLAEELAGHVEGAWEG
eukprot:scaffold63257_cov59-Phaeocystis_antarctica.AAC.2